MTRQEGVWQINGPISSPSCLSSSARTSPWPNTPRSWKGSPLTPSVGASLLGTEQGGQRRLDLGGQVQRDGVQHLIPSGPDKRRGFGGDLSDTIFSLTSQLSVGNEIPLSLSVQEIRSEVGWLKSEFVNHGFGGAYCSTGS